MKEGMKEVKMEYDKNHQIMKRYRVNNNNKDTHK